MSTEGSTHYAIVYGQVEHNSLAEAAEESPPTILPSSIKGLGILLGVFTVVKDGTAPTEVRSAFTTTFSSAQVTSHTELADIGTNTHAQIDVVLASTSGTNTGDQDLSGLAPIASPSFTGDTTVVEFTETVYTMSGTVFDTANGTVQSKGLTANTTITESLTTGQAGTLLVTAGNTYTLTFPAHEVIGTLPTPSAKDIYVLTKIGATLYIAGGNVA